MSNWSYAGVAVLGGVGALARFLVDDALRRPRGLVFPLGTLVVNVVGSFLLGLLVGAAVAPLVDVLVGTALLGSFTTFSTWMLETERLVEDGLDRHAAVNVLGSLVLGLAAAAGGWALGALG